MTLSDKKILNKVINGNSSKENAQCVADWFSSTIEGQQTLSDMIDQDAYLMEENLLKENHINPIQSKLLFKKIEKEIRIKKTKRRWLQSAAIAIPFVIILGLGIYANKHWGLLSQPTYAEIYIPKGEKARILFQDGSEAFLNADTRIRYPKKFGLRKRTVQLQGEAYFNVAHNKYRPFIVETTNSSVEVLGTSFNVKAYHEDETTDVTLDEGSIVFHSSHNKYQLKPGQQIAYDKESGALTVRNLRNSAYNSLWISNVFYFNDTPLKQIIQILERNFNVEFTVKDIHALDYSYTIITEMKNIEDILLELEKIAPVKFNLQKNGIYEILIP